MAASEPEGSGRPQPRPGCSGLPGARTEGHGQRPAGAGQGARGRVQSPRVSTAAGVTLLAGHAPCMKKSRFGQNPVEAVPQWAAKRRSLPRDPVASRGSGNLSPPAPRGQVQRPGHSRQHSPEHARAGSPDRPGPLSTLWSASKEQRRRPAPPGAAVLVLRAWLRAGCRFPGATPMVAAQSLRRVIRSWLASSPPPASA